MLLNVFGRTAFKCPRKLREIKHGENTIIRNAAEGVENDGVIVNS